MVTYFCRAYHKQLPIEDLLSLEHDFGCIAIETPDPVRKCGDYHLDAEEEFSDNQMRDITETFALEFV